MICSPSRWPDEMRLSRWWLASFPCALAGRDAFESQVVGVVPRCIGRTRGGLDWGYRRKDRGASTAVRGARFDGDSSVGFCSSVSSETSQPLRPAHKLKPPALLRDTYLAFSLIYMETVCPTFPICLRKSSENLEVD